MPSLPGPRPALAERYFRPTSTTGAICNCQPATWPGFLRVSVGHSITDWIDPLTGANIRAQRKIFLTLDLDAEKLPGNNRIWKTVKRQLGYIHLPSPAIQITPSTEFIRWYR